MGYLNGDTAEWVLHDAMNLGKFVKILTRRTGSGIVSFGIPSEERGASDYDFVGLAMAEVISWQVRGLFEATSGAALWEELQELGECKSHRNERPPSAASLAHTPLEGTRRRCRT